MKYIVLACVISLFPAGDLFKITIDQNCIYQFPPNFLFHNGIAPIYGKIFCYSSSVYGKDIDNNMICMEIE